METLLKETVDITVNSRYPGMAPEGRRQIEEILIRKEVEKGELLLKEGQISHNIVLVGKGMLRQFYYKNGKDVTEHFSYEGCIVICIESTLKKEPTHLMIEALEDSIVYLLPYEQVDVTNRNLPGNQYDSIARYLNTPLLFHKSKPIPGGSRLHASVTTN